MEEKSLWRLLILNRFTLTFVAIALIILLWNLYVSANDDGILSGQVLDAAGAPVAGAEVVLSEQTIVSLTPMAKTVSDDNGYFTFTKHDRHYVVLTASKEGLGKSARYEVRLFFRNQNRTLEQALRL